MAMDFTRVISEYITKTSIPPDQLVWCGSDAVTLHWPGILLVIGPHGHSITYTVYRNAALISEIDGLRVITSTHHDVICRVPDFLVDVFSMGSKTPAAALHNAAECSFKDLKSTERLLELIGDNMSKLCKVHPRRLPCIELQTAVGTLASGTSWAFTFEIKS